RAGADSAQLLDPVRGSSDGEGEDSDCHGADERSSPEPPEAAQLREEGSHRLVAVLGSLLKPSLKRLEEAPRRFAFGGAGDSKLRGPSLQIHSARQLAGQCLVQRDT